MSMKIIEKLGFTGVYLFFLFWLQTIDCAEGVLTYTQNLCLEQKQQQKKKKNQKLSSENVSFFFTCEKKNLYIIAWALDKFS